MSYTPHVWANGQNGVSAVGWLNNMEEGVRAAMAAAEATADHYDITDPASVYKQAQALNTSANSDAGTANSVYSRVVAEQSKIAKRNTYLALKNGAAGSGSGIQVSGLQRLNINGFPLGGNSPTTYQATLAGFYMFMINASICGPNAKIRIRKNFSTIETLKLITFPDISIGQEWATISICVIRQLLANDQIDFLMDMDAADARMMDFRVFVRKM
jgi:hypothetical protein